MVTRESKDRNRCRQWRLGWLPGGTPKICKTCQYQHFSKQRAITCLQMHSRLNLTEQQTSDAISYIINKLSKSKPTSSQCINFLTSVWSTICILLAELGEHQHPDSGEQQYYQPDPGRALISWIAPPTDDLAKYLLFYS